MVFAESWVCTFMRILLFFENLQWPRGSTIPKNRNGFADALFIRFSENGVSVVWDDRSDDP